MVALDGVEILKAPPLSALKFYPVDFVSSLPLSSRETEGSNPKVHPKVGESFMKCTSCCRPLLRGAK